MVHSKVLQQYFSSIFTRGIDVRYSLTSNFPQVLQYLGVNWSVSEIRYFK